VRCLAGGGAGGQFSFHPTTVAAGDRPSCINRGIVPQVVARALDRGRRDLTPVPSQRRRFARSGTDAPYPLVEIESALVRSAQLVKQQVSCLVAAGCRTPLGTRRPGVGARVDRVCEKASVVSTRV